MTKTARPTLPALAIEKQFKKELKKFVKKMAKRLDEKIMPIYEEYEGIILQASVSDSCVKLVNDEHIPANELEKALREILDSWNKDLDANSKRLAENFVKKMDNSTKARLASSLREASGLGIKFKTTNSVENVLQSLIYEQTSLIKSIPSKYAAEVEGIVMRSVRNGRDKGYLITELNSRYELTESRVKTIVRDQTNKATESITRTRAESLGITEGIWMHRPVSKKPRSSHQKLNGQRFNLQKGVYDQASKKYIHPGELVNCH